MELASDKADPADSNAENAKIKRPWKSFKEIRTTAGNDMIRKMASANYKGIGGYIKIKIRRMLEQLDSNNINLDSIRILCFNGIVEDCRGLRSTVWKLLLYYLPPNSSLWLSVMQSKLEEYNALREKYIPGLIPTSLSNGRESLWEDVEKDIKRTRADVAFFIEPLDKKTKVDASLLYDLSQLRKHELSPAQQANYVMTHADVLGRILYVYGCRHPDVLYVQGMNELLAVIYYVFAKDCIGGYEEFVESDSFFAFENLMDELKDSFNEKMDKKSGGIRAKLKLIEGLIERNRKGLWKVLQDQGINIDIFAIRWQMLLLSQDFTIPDVIRLWDSLLADAARFNFFSYVCLALLVNVEGEILEGEFDTILKAVNTSSSKIEMNDLIILARELLTKEAEQYKLEIPEKKK